MQLRCSKRDPNAVVGKRLAFAGKRASIDTSGEIAAPTPALDTIECDSQRKTLAMSLGCKLTWSPYGVDVNSQPKNAE